MTGITDALLSLLACPVCKGPLELAEAELACVTCRAAYPIDEGVPVLLVERARRIEA